MHTRSSDEIDEILQVLFCLKEDRKTAPEDEILQRAGASADSLAQAMQSGLIVRNADGLALSEHGEQDAAMVVRRHRLAERLLHDVLRISDEVSESAACQFEHILDGEVAESICTLLGHPRACPHGKPIPPGPCCSGGKENVASLVRKLSDLQAGEGGRVIYIHTASPERLNRLSSFGVLPGTYLKINQRWPSVVVELGHTQLALDRETADDIFVRRAPAAEPTPSMFRLRRRRGRT